MRFKFSLAPIIGIVILVVLLITYFIPVLADSGVNYMIYEPLLGILIFSNPFILGIYILIGVFLIGRGFRNPGRKTKEDKRGKKNGK